MKPLLLATATILTASLGASLPAAVQAPASAPESAEDARLTAFLDGEFTELVKLQPQTATRLGIKEGGDRWNDIRDSAADAMAAWRKASAERMKARFDRTKLSPEGQVNYDIWALEAERAALSNATASTGRRSIPGFIQRTASFPIF